MPTGTEPHQPSYEELMRLVLARDAELGVLKLIIEKLKVQLARRNRADFASNCAHQAKNFSRASAPGDSQSSRVDRQNLNDAFCKVNADSCNLVHGTSPSKGCQLTFANQSWRLTPLPGSGKSLRIR